MKKVFFIISIIILILLLGFGLFYFLGGKNKVNNFLSENSFGSFFDADQTSKNDFEPILNGEDELLETSKNTLYEAPILRQLSFEPVSGYTYYSTSSTSTRTYVDAEGQEVAEDFIATSTAFRFQERGTGHIYDVFAFIESPQKVSNITNQKIYSTQFTSNKDSYIYSKLSTDNEKIITTHSSLSISSTTGEVFDISKEISSIIPNFILNKNNNKLIYSIEQQGVSGIYTSNIDRTNEKLIKTLYFNEFLLDKINDISILITTKPSIVAEGYSYVLNTNTGTFTKVLGGIKGLTTKVSPDEKKYIYAESEKNRPNLKLFNKDTNSTIILTFDTIPSEKCVFSKDSKNIYCFGSLMYKSAQYPDDWYKGKIFNTENLYKISTETGEASLVYNFQSEDLTFDAMNIELTSNDSYIIFQNKNDLTLWSLNLDKLTNELN